MHKYKYCMNHVYLYFCFHLFIIPRFVFGKCRGLIWVRQGCHWVAPSPTYCMLKICVYLPPMVSLDLWCRIFFMRIWWSACDAHVGEQAVVESYKSCLWIDWKIIPHCCRAGSNHTVRQEVWRPIDYVISLIIYCMMYSHCFEANNFINQ